MTGLQHRSFFLFLLFYITITQDMKKSKSFTIVLLTVAGVLLLDQGLKLWVHTHMHPGESLYILGEKFQLHYILNNGMAFGMQWGGNAGKLFLTLFRMLAVGVIAWYLRSLIKKGAPAGLIFSLSLILAGALGNIIDSMFYGILFQNKPFLFGEVIDMLYFPLFHFQLPAWLPVWGGEEFEFFRPVFNIADSAITTGVLVILVFQRKFFDSSETAVVTNKK